MAIAVFSFDLSDGKLGSMLHTEKTYYFRVIVCWAFRIAINTNFRLFSSDLDVEASAIRFESIERRTDNIGHRNSQFCK